MTLSVLLTAFEPFGGRAKNASAEALAGVMQQAGALPGLSLTARLLPVEAGLAADQLRSALDEVRPDVLLSLGEAPRDVVCLEQMGYNERRFSIPDNAGNLLTDQPVFRADRPPIRPAYRWRLCWRPSRLSRCPFVSPTIRGAIFATRSSIPGWPMPRSALPIFGWGSSMCPTCHRQLPILTTHPCRPIRS